KKLRRRTPDLQDTIGQVKQAADAGYLPAQIKLAWSHVFGEGVTLDVARAKDIFQRLAELGNAEAHAKLHRRMPDLPDTIGQVKQAADAGYLPAQIKLAWSHVFGEGVTLDVARAKDIFQRLAELGNAEAHAGMGFLYASGIAVPVSQPKALVHYNLGALGHSSYAQMALAYRHWAAVSVPGSCPKALDLYMKVAAKVAGEVTFSGGPAVLRTRLVDEAEGGGALDTDLIEYYQLLAEKGDVGLGQLHFQGGRGVTLDLNKALHYFTQAAKTGNAANKYFSLASQSGHVLALYHLAQMHAQGLGVMRSCTTAVESLYKYFSLVSQSGHVLALYHLAQMHAQGLGVMRSCTTAVELFKNVCERGAWASRLMTAHSAWRARDSDSAWLQYRALAERGYEIASEQLHNAQATFNLGYMHERGLGLTRDLHLAKRCYDLEQLHNAQATFNLGYMHERGLGLTRDLHLAKRCYDLEQLHNAQATFNLGYMHERGLGLTRDLHLAKRCYDLEQLHNAQATFNLGYMHERGLGLTRDLHLAKRCYDLEQLHNAQATFNLGYMHERGLGLTRDLHLAKRCYDLEQLHNAQATFNLGYMHERGLGLTRDLHLAKRCYDLEQLHNAQATFNLGYMHERGLGLTRDLHLAKRCYDLEQLHNAQATFNLGYMHERGLGLTRDLHLAKRCYDLGTHLCSPFTFVFLHDKSFVSNWDVYAITLFAGLIALLAYWRRLPEARPQQPQQQQQ
ncbi:putative Sel1l protein, partial [Operophtera brumata]